MQDPSSVQSTSPSLDPTSPSVQQSELPPYIIHSSILSLKTKQVASKRADLVTHLDLDSNSLSSTASPRGFSHPYLLSDHPAPTTITSSPPSLHPPLGVVKYSETIVRPTIYPDSFAHQRHSPGMRPQGWIPAGSRPVKMARIWVTGS